MEDVRAVVTPTTGLVCLAPAGEIASTHGSLTPRERHAAETTAISRNIALEGAIRLGT